MAEPPLVRVLFVVAFTRDPLRTEPGPGELREIGPLPPELVRDLLAPGGVVRLFHAVAVPQEFPAAAANHADPLQDLLLARSRAALEKLAAGDAQVLLEPIEVLRGQPWRAILTASERLQADIIVIGSHGFGGWAGCSGPPPPRWRTTRSAACWWSTIETACQLRLAPPSRGAWPGQLVRRAHPWRNRRAGRAEGVQGTLGVMAFAAQRTGQLHPAHPR